MSTPTGGGRKDPLAQQAFGRQILWAQVDDPFHQKQITRGITLRITHRGAIAAAAALLAATALAGCSTTGPVSATSARQVTSFSVAAAGKMKVRVVQVAKANSAVTKSPICIVGVEITAGSFPADPGNYDYQFAKTGKGLFAGPVTGAKSADGGKYALLDGWPIVFDGVKRFSVKGAVVGQDGQGVLQPGEVGRIAYAYKCTDLSATAKIEDATADPTVYKTFDATWK